MLESCFSFVVTNVRKIFFLFFFSNYFLCNKHWTSECYIAPETEFTWHRLLLAIFCVYFNSVSAVFFSFLNLSHFSRQHNRLLSINSIIFSAFLTFYLSKKQSISFLFRKKKSNVSSLMNSQDRYALPIANK